uniref:Uncharacterized protein n=1 Tax=Ditylenchus dipsaci TaxID=166011 RepID=A0A915EL98_9BILA
MFTIVPIEGMEFIQKNFVKYQSGEQAAADLVGSERVTLAKRFQLIERGYSLKLKDEQLARNKQNSFHSTITFLQFQAPKLETGKENNSSQKKETTKQSSTGKTDDKVSQVVISNNKRPLCNKQEFCSNVS